MAIVESESLVLKSYDLAEADRIVVLLTKDHGVVRAVAKGAKRLKSKFGSGLEPFSQVQVTYFEKDTLELVSLQKIELIRSSFREASDPDFLQKFSYLSDLVVAILPPHDPNEVLYRMFKACLAAAAADNAGHRAIGVYFELWLLRIAGYLPDWSRCYLCTRELYPLEVLSFAKDFHICCKSCLQPRSMNTITPKERELASLAQKVGPPDFVSSAKDLPVELDRLSITLKRMISIAIGKDIVTN